ncbi:MAG: 3'-5' exonuclease [Candidatus Gastranaerophilales bacterium]|nr:3'-5' exonuclease [Candidatus Gastranaerophilales bacterium]
MKISAINNANRSNKMMLSQNIIEKNPQLYKNNPITKSQGNAFRAYTPAFTGLWFENNIVKKVEGKKYQGKGLYTPNGHYVDFNKVGWEHLSKEPLDLRTATDTEIYAFQHANALAETNDTTWVRRYNNYNVTKPLATFHTLNSQKSKASFSTNLTALHDVSIHKSLDVPITDDNGKLSLDCTVFDTETTGVNLTDTSKPLDKIIQIGALQVKDGDIVTDSGYSQLLNPETHIPEGSTAVHGITDEMVQDKPNIEQVLKPFVNDYLNKKNGVIVAYNSKFDITILNNAIREHNSYSHEPLKEKQAFKVLDPFVLIQRIHPYVGAKKKLSEQYKFLFCKNLDDAHDAFADVKGTVDVMKYALYYLSEHRVDKSKPLTLREVLVFQNGGKVENIDIPLDREGCRADVNFRKSYSQVSMAVDNYFKGYKLTPKSLKELEPEIGAENIQKLQGIKNKQIDLNPKDGYPINPSEAEPKKDGGVQNAFYVMEKNFNKVLDFYKIDSYGELSKEDVKAIITEKAKQYIHEDSVDIWMKNPNPKDIPDGNDMPDYKIAKRVMQEDIKE